MGKATRRGVIAASAAAAALVIAPAALAFPAPSSHNIAPDIPGALDQTIVGSTGNQSTFFRFASKDRVHTALFAAQNTHGYGRDVAILATSADYADALAAAPLAEQYSAPILLANADGSIAPQVRTELAKYQTIIVVSGTGHISDSVTASLLGATTTDVVRVAGVNRFETAALLAVYSYATNGYQGGLNYILADGTNFPDALAAGPAATSVPNGLILLTDGAKGVSPFTYAVLNGQPVSWTNASLLPQHTANGNAINWLVGLGGSRNVTAVGGNANAAAANGIGLPGTSIAVDSKLVGADRYETAVLVAKKYYDSAPTYYTIASGQSFPDAVVGGSWAANAGGPLLLTRDAKLTPVTKAYLEDIADNGDKFVVFGGTGSVTPAVSQELFETFQW
ncbi:cell wall-binding repeat-containing protein [Salana multivorans]